MDAKKPESIAPPEKREDSEVKPSAALRRFPKLLRQLLDTSIRIKLMGLMAFSSGFALLLAGGGLLSYELLQFRNSATREATTVAEIVATGTTAALSFSDERTAGETLSWLGGDERISSAAVYDKTGRLFAAYRNPKKPVAVPPDRAKPDGVYFDNGQLFLFHPVLLLGERIGTVHLRLDMGEIYLKMYRYAGIVVLVLLASLGLALLLSAPVQRIISEPITELAAAARLVTAEKNYSIRVKKVAGDEVGVLIDSFNGMLSQIEIQEKDRKVAEAALRESEERYALAAHGANDGLWDWKLLTNVIYFSSRWTRMIGYSDNETWSNPEEWFSRIHPADRDRVRAQLDAHLKGSTSEFSSEYRIRNKNGFYVWMLSRGIAVRDDHGVAVRIAGSQTDITEGKIADALTSLPNRLYLMDKLESAIVAKGNPGGNAFAVLFLDLDRFKVVNDSLGHAAGDQLLMGVAQRLRTSVRGPGTLGRLTDSSSTVARIGGDEFAILIEGMSQPDDAAIIAERILKHLRSAFYLDGRQVFTTASIGIAMSTSGETAEDLLRNADTAMYNSKSRGPGEFAIFDQTMRERAVARMELEEDLKAALTRNEFVLYYQPNVSLDDKRITGFEALIRWNHPRRGLVYPSEFIPVAEESGLIVPIGLWVLREACTQMAAWHKTMVREPALTISVNVSFKQLSGEGLADDVLQILKETGLDPASLKLEMTESSIMENAQLAISTLHRFKEMQIGLEIDDFGTGYSSFAYLRQLPFDTVKIDHSFVRELGTPDDTTKIIDTILKMAHSLGMDVVAEGVETMDQLARLTAMGCTSVQGYYFSKPVSAENAQRLLEDRDTLGRGMTLRPAAQRALAVAAPVTAIPVVAAVAATAEPEEVTS